MSNGDFVHLHNHSDSSMLDGFPKISQYLDRAEELGMPGVGVSDHGNTHASYEIVTQARSRGMIGVPGCEFYVAPENPEGARVKGPVYYGPDGQKTPGGKDVSGDGAFLHLTVWAHTQEGMRNLFKLSSMSNQQENFYSKPRIDFSMLAEHSEGLVVSTGCPSSEISTRFRLRQDRKAYEYAGRLKDVFGERLFVEIMEHSMTEDLERDLLPKQLELSKKLGIPLLATNDCHYSHPEHALHQEEMLCLQSGSRMSELPYDQGGTRFAFNGSGYYMKSAQEMQELFPDRDFPGATKNTLLVAEMAQDIKLDYDPNLMPDPVIPAGFNSAVEYYRHLLEEGFKIRYGTSSPEIQAEARRRMEYEFDVIYSSNFVGYMLTVAEYMVWTREQFSIRDTTGDILALPVGVGRGSVGGSIHAYLLLISELDPIRWDLVFERFLSAGRGATYEIEYDDGTTEEIIVSAEKQVLPDLDSNLEDPDAHTVVKYIHELNVGDAVIVDE